MLMGFALAWWLGEGMELKDMVSLAFLFERRQYLLEAEL
jgi:hypothetical protein